MMPGKEYWIDMYIDEMDYNQLENWLEKIRKKGNPPITSIYHGDNGNVTGSEEFESIDIQRAIKEVKKGNTISTAVYFEGTQEVGV